MKKYWIGITILCIVMGIVGINKIMMSGGDTPSQDVVAQVNGLEISKDAMQLLCERYRGKVYAHYAQEYGADVNAPDFWTRTYGKMTPAEALKRMALDEWIRIKVEQSLARSLNIKLVVEYDKLIQAVQDENAKRAARIENGDVVMGVKSYDTYTFLTEQSLRVREEIVAKMQKDIDMSHENFLQYYEKIKDQAFRKEDNYVVEVLFFERGHDKKRDDQKRAKAQAASAAYQAGHSFDEVYAIYQEDASLNILEFNPASYEVYRNIYDALIRQLSQMEVGDVSDVIFEYDGYYLVRMLEKEPQGYLPFSQVEEMVNVYYSEERYLDYLQNLVQEAEIEIYEKNLQTMKLF